MIHIGDSAISKNGVSFDLRRLHTNKGETIIKQIMTIIVIYITFYKRNTYSAMKEKNWEVGSLVQSV